MILLYTAVNVSLAVWLLKGFIDEIPREYEEAAMIDGYTRLQAFWKVVLPQAATGIAATAIFCLIFAWNEYAFAVLLTSGDGADRAALHPHHHRRGRAGLAGGGGRHDAVPDADPGLHRAAAQAPAARHHLRGGAQMSEPVASRARRSRPLVAACFRRGPWEILATVVIAAGVLMLMQPFSLDALHLVVRDDARRHRDVHHRLEVSGVSRWPRSGSRTCARPSATSSR